MSRVFYTSDLHIGHKLVAVERFCRVHGTGPDDVIDVEHAVSWHDAVLAENWDNTVDDADTVWVVGDISVGGSMQRPALEWVSQRTGIKKLIAGNHDGVHGSHRDADKWFEAYAGVFRHVGDFMRRRVAGHTVMMSHYPYEGDHTPVDRDTQYRLPDEGHPVICGHTHSIERVSRTAAGTMQINVGADAWNMTPVPHSTIEEMVKSEMDGRRVQ